jgi:hypothetical protein
VDYFFIVHTYNRLLCYYNCVIKKVRSYAFEEQNTAQQAYFKCPMFKEPGRVWGNLPNG